MLNWILLSVQSWYKLAIDTFYTSIFDLIIFKNLAVHIISEDIKNGYTFRKNITIILLDANDFVKSTNDLYTNILLSFQLNVPLLLNIPLVVLTVLLLLLKVIQLIEQNKKYSYVKATLLLLLCVFITFNKLNLVFWVFFITIAELTSIYLISIILLNVTSLKTNKMYIYLFTLLGLMYVAPNKISYVWFDFYQLTLTKFNQLEVFKSTVNYTNIIFILLLIIWILSILLLFYLLSIICKTNNIDIKSFIYKLKILINSTSDSLNMYYKNNIFKWFK